MRLCSESYSKVGCDQIVVKKTCQSSRHTGKPGKQYGFTLLETLVALSVLAISLGVTYQVFSSALRSSTLANDYAQASMYADSHLAEISKDVSKLSRVTRGAYNDRYRWKLEIIPLDVTSSRTVIETVKRYQVTINVYWKSGRGERSISASTFRLASA